MKNRKIIIAMLAVLISMQIGCTSVDSIPENTTEATIETTTTQATTKVPEITTVSTSMTTAAISTIEATTAVMPTNYPDELVENYKEYTFSNDDNNFLKDVVFVGDSICSGIYLYDVHPKKQVLAKGNIGAWSIYDYTFNVNGEEHNFATALEILQPKSIVFSMGMNDVFWTSIETFIDNYKKALTDTEKRCPNSNIYVFGVTPAAYISKFGTAEPNINIDTYNEALKKMVDAHENWQYIDVSTEMKNNFNALKTNYCGAEDGLHLSKAAYYSMLWSLCDQRVEHIQNVTDVTTAAVTTQGTMETTALQVSTTAKTVETESLTTTESQVTTVPVTVSPISDTGITTAAITVASSEEDVILIMN